MVARSTARIALGLLGSVFLTLACAGCGDGRPARVPVSGTVLIDGQPLSRGSITFVQSGTRPAAGAIDSAGRFTLTCFAAGDGAIPGHYRVAVAGLEPVNERTNRWHAPKKYSDLSTSGIEVEITAPVDDLMIELTWDGGKPFVENL